MSRVVKTCACGLEYTREAWDKLAFVGMSGDSVERLEQRDCRCGSTISIATLLVKVVYTIEPVKTKVRSGWMIWRKASNEVRAIDFSGAEMMQGAYIFASLEEVQWQCSKQRELDAVAALRLGVEIAASEENGS
jgi:hypothetical protein